jgi:hypothetical protein
MKMSVKCIGATRGQSTENDYTQRLGWYGVRSSVTHPLRIAVVDVVAMALVASQYVGCRVREQHELSRPELDSLLFTLVSVVAVIVAVIVDGHIVV